MQRSNSAFLCMFILMCNILLITPSCKKDNTAPALDPASIYIKETVTSDTLSCLVSTEKDTAIVMQITPAVNGTMNNGAHVVTFRIDTGRIKDYVARYGNADLLPAICYNVAWLDCPSKAGTNTFQPAEINIVNERQLQASSIYVLPVVLQSVDGDTAGIAHGQVLYLKVRTKESPIIGKANWKIAGYSSALTYPQLPSLNYFFAAANVLDNDASTAWYADPSLPLPQYVAIDMGKQEAVGRITYSGYSTADYGYPTQVKIELSTDGTNWMDRGTFTTDPSPGQKTISISATTGRYIRFSVLAWSVTGGYTVIAEIGAMRPL